MRIQYYYFRKAVTDIESKGNPNPKLKIQLCVKQSYNSAFLAEDGKDWNRLQLEEQGQLFKVPSWQVMVYFPFDVFVLVF